MAHRVQRRLSHSHAQHPVPTVPRTVVRLLPLTSAMALRHSF